MKQPFRYFRGEFTGKYLYAAAVCPNYAVQDILDELVYNALFQWKLEDEISRGEMPIRYKDIINIGIIAGLFQSLSYGLSSVGSIYFTQSHIVDGQERSERGLMDMEQEKFRFIREQQDEYPDDIVSEASEDYRASVVPKGTEPVGYVPEGTPLYTADGEVIWENLLPAPPDDGTPYTTFYGEKFLIHEEYFNRKMNLPIEIFKLLLECVQKIRYNGPTIAGFMEVTRTLGDGYICDIEIKYEERYYIVLYSLSGAKEITMRDRRLAAWFYICNRKFKLFVLRNREA